jgi:quinol monooxygenase YgiN
MVTVVGKITAKGEAIGKVRTQLTSLVEPSRKERGCIHYSLYQDIDNPTTFLVYEKWENKSDLDTHMSTRNFKECFSAIEGLYKVEVHLLSEVR